MPTAPGARRAMGGAIILAAGYFGRVAHATPADMFGIGPRTQALAGAGATLDIGHEATFTNPAALSLAQESEITLGVHGARFSIDVAGGGRAPGPFSLGAASGFLFGLVVPFTVGDEELALGLASRSPSDVIARAHLPYPETPQFPLLDSGAHALDFNVGLGFSVGERLALGLGLRVLASLGGRVTVARGAAGNTQSEVDDELTPTYALTAGMRVDLGADAAAALVWRSALRADFGVQVLASDLAPLVLPVLNIAGVAAYDPAELHAELSRQFAGWTLLAALTYKHWSAFPGWLGATTTCPAGPSTCAALGVEPPDYHDTWIPRVAIALAFDLAREARAELRAGYFFEPSPVPEQRGAGNTWDNSRHAFSLGYGVELCAPLPPVRVDAAFQLQSFVARTHAKDRTVSQDNAGFPEIRIAGSTLSFALSGGVSF